MSCSHKRKVEGYLKPAYHRLFKAYAEVNEIGNSEVLNMAVKTFFDTMPQNVKERLLARSASSNAGAVVQD